MSLRVCIDCPTPVPQGQGRCKACAREHDKARGTAAQRGYGAEHQRTRADLAPKAIGKPCHFCGEPMLVGQLLALDHTVDRTGYRGMVHLVCNARDGGRRTPR